LAKAKDLTVRQIKSKDERKSGNLFLRLKTDEKFKGNALFEMNPEAEKNPGYYEYLEHYDNSNNTYVPCTGDDCYMCELGDNPSGKALTLWHFPDEDAKDQMKVFKLNGFLIRDFTEIEEEEGGVKGRLFRVKRLSDRGEYRATPQADKPLTQKEIKELLKDAPDFEEMVLKQAKNAFQAHKATAALEDADDDDDEDDDDDDEVETSSKGGKAKDKSKKAAKDDDDEEDDDEDEDEDEDEDDEDDEEDEEEDEDDDEEEESDDDDEDEDEEPDDDEGDESESVEKVKATVKATNEKDETITLVEFEGKKNVKAWVGQDLEVDFDKVEKGSEITVDAAQDDEGDWILTAVKVGKAKGGKGKGGKGKGGKKK
jgi:hypothetical protein